MNESAKSLLSVLKQTNSWSCIVKATTFRAFWGHGEQKLPETPTKGMIISCC